MVKQGSAPSRQNLWFRGGQECISLWKPNLVSCKSILWLGTVRNQERPLVKVHPLLKPRGEGTVERCWGLVPCARVRVSEGSLERCSSCSLVSVYYRYETTVNDSSSHGVEPAQTYKTNWMSCEQQSWRSRAAQDLWSPGNHSGSQIWGTELSTLLNFGFALLWFCALFFSILV